MHGYKGEGGLQFTIHLDPKLFVFGKMAGASNIGAIADFAKDARFGEPFPHFLNETALRRREQKPHSLQAGLPILETSHTRRESML